MDAVCSAVTQRGNIIKWDDSDVTSSVYNSKCRHVGGMLVNLRMLANCCVWNYIPVDIHGLQITLGQ